MNTPRILLRLSVSAFLVMGCDNIDTTAPAGAEVPEIRAAKSTSSGYAPIEIGTLPGDVESYASVVNNAGHVVVSSTYFSSTEPRRGRWFIRAGSQNFILQDGMMSDLSNGAVTHVGGTIGAGDGNVAPAIWTFDPVTGFSGPTVLDYSPASGGSIQTVSDAGQAAGNVSGGTIWNTDGTRTAIPNPDPSVFEFTSVRDVNNSGDVALYMHDNERNHHRAYLRTSDGAMILLPPISGHVSSTARGVSEIVDGLLYVAGTTDDRQGNYRAVRWTIDVASHAIAATLVRPDRSYSTGMADDGTITGDLATNGGTIPFVWRMNNTTVTLKAPKGLSSPTAWSISGNGRYVSGQARSGSYGRAVYWAANP